MMMALGIMAATVLLVVAQPPTASCQRAEPFKVSGSLFLSAVYTIGYNVI